MQRMVGSSTGSVVAIWQVLKIWLTFREKGIQMTRIRVEGFTISLDGYATGPHQNLENPFGVVGTDLHQ